MNNGDSNLNNELSNDVTIDNAVINQPTDDSINYLGDPVFNYIPNDVIDNSSVISVDDDISIDINQEVSNPMPVVEAPVEVETPVEDPVSEVGPVAVEEPAPAVEIPAVEAPVVEATPVVEAPVAETTPVVPEPVVVVETPAEPVPVETPVVETPAVDTAPSEAPVMPDVAVPEVPVVDYAAEESAPVFDAPVTENPVVEPAPVESPAYVGEVPAEFESMISQAPIETNAVPVAEPAPVEVNPSVEVAVDPNQMPAAPMPEANVVPDMAVPVAEPVTEAPVQNQVFNTDIPQGLPKFDDGKKKKKRKKVSTSGGKSDAQKDKIKNMIEIGVIVVGLIAFVIIFFKDSIFPKKEEEKPEVIITAKEGFVRNASSISYQKVIDLRTKIFEEYKAGSGNFKVSSKAIGMNELDFDFNISIDKEEKSDLPWVYFYGNGTYDKEKLFYSDLQLYYYNKNIWFWIPKTAETDKIDSTKDKFFMGSGFILDNRLTDKYGEDFARFMELAIDYVNVNFDESYFNSRKEGNSDVYQLNLEGKALRDLGYLLLPMLNEDFEFNALFSNIFGDSIDYIYFMGDPEEYDENDENNEVFETVEDLAKVVSLKVDVYEENSVLNKVYIEYKDPDEKIHYITFTFDENNYDLVSSYKSKNSETATTEFHDTLKIDGDHYILSLDYGMAYKLDLDVTFAYEDKTKLPNIVAIRNYWGEEEVVRREIQYRFEKSPGITKFKKDTGINLDFIFKEQEEE